jgi:hypothetical protein
MRMGLTCLASRWASSPLVVKAMLIVDSGEWFTVLSMSHAISSEVHE